MLQYAEPCGDALNTFAKSWQGSVYVAPAAAAPVALLGGVASALQPWFFGAVCMVSYSILNIVYCSILSYILVSYSIV